MLKVNMPFYIYCHYILLKKSVFQYNVACCLQAGIMESDRKSISWTTASIASQRLGKQLLLLQQMLTKVIPMTTTSITGKFTFRQGVSYSVHQEPISGQRAFPTEADQN
jgi:hypothetical protein